MTNLLVPLWSAWTDIAGYVDARMIKVSANGWLCMSGIVVAATGTVIVLKYRSIRGEGVHKCKSLSFRTRIEVAVDGICS